MGWFASSYRIGCPIMFNLYPSALSQSKTLATVEECVFDTPSLKMVQSQRLYRVDDEFAAYVKRISLPSVVFRDVHARMAQLSPRVYVREHWSSNEQFGATDVFITGKAINTPNQMKRVKWEDVAPYMSQVRKCKRSTGLFCAVGEYFVNEYFAGLLPEDHTLSVEFLAVFNPLLHLANGESHTVNYRTLEHRIMSRKLRDEEIAWVLNNLPEMASRLNLFQGEPI